MRRFNIRHISFVGFLVCALLFYCEFLVYYLVKIQKSFATCKYCTPFPEVSKISSINNWTTFHCWPLFPVKKKLFTSFKRFIKSRSGFVELSLSGIWSRRSHPPSGSINYSRFKPFVSNQPQRTNHGNGDDTETVIILTRDLC